MAVPAKVAIFIGNMNDKILLPVAQFFMALAVAVFLWGVVEYLFKGRDNPSVKDEASKHMLWGIVGLFVMISAIAIIKVVLGTFGIDEAPLRNIPFGK